MVRAFHHCEPAKRVYRHGDTPERRSDGRRLQSGRVRIGRTTIFAFEKHCRPEAYRRITAQASAVEPPGWTKQAAEQHQSRH
jgi:hypothetical protein